MQHKDRYRNKMLAGIFYFILHIIIAMVAVLINQRQQPVMSCITAARSIGHKNAFCSLLPQTAAKHINLFYRHSFQYKRNRLFFLAFKTFD
ncbi:MAG: hypothetical protein JWP81_1573 [Ferruginibacter sp.]|nr:hypothetical protein [Ferruginibacter sp.]